LKDKKAIAEIICTLTFRTCLIVYMEGIYEKDRMDSVFGDEPFYIKKEQLEKYRSNNFNMAARRDLYEGGLKYSEQWAGKDKPETIKKLYDDSSNWIFN